MNCYAHEDRNSVATCGDCGVGLCKECEEATIYRTDKKALCKKCNYKYACENNNIYEKTLQSKKTLLIINSIACGIGVIILFILLLTGNGTFGAVIGMFICWSLGYIVSTFFDRSLKAKKTKTMRHPNPIINFIMDIFGAIFKFLLQGIL